MSDKLELEVNVTGVEQAIDQVQGIQDAGQSPAGGTFSRSWDPFESGQPPPHDWQGAVAMKKKLAVEEREAKRVAAMHERSHAATLRYRVQEGRRQIKEQERIEKATMREQQQMQRRVERERQQEEKRMRRENIAIENAAIKQDNAARRRRQQMMDAGMGLAVKAGAAVAATTMYGFKGTVEGNRFANEMKMIAREMAGVFKPAMDAATGAVGWLRKKAQNLSEDEQDYLLYGAVGIGGAYLARLAYRSGALHLAGAAIGGAGRFAMNNPGMAGRMGVYGGLAYGAYRSYDTVSTAQHNQERRDAVINRGGAFTADELGANRDVFEAYQSARTGTQRHMLLRRAYADAAEQQTAIAARQDDRTWAGMKLSAAGFNPAYGTEIKESQHQLMRMEMIRRMMHDDEFARTGIDPTNPNRRRVMDATAVGYGEVGSTAELIQEEMLKVTSDDMNIKSEREEQKIMAGALLSILQVAKEIASRSQELPINPPG